MIRTFDTNGNTIHAYKLYSSSQMLESGTAFLATELTAVTGSGAWYKYPALYTDLNQPVVSGTTQRASLFLTVVPSRLAASGTVPANYATVQLNPDNGSPLLFRP